MKIGCDLFRRTHRRDFLRVGGLGLCGVTMLDVLRARTEAAPSASGRTARGPRAKHLICVWLGGGPPHTDMFDMKPESPVDYRGEFKPIATNVPGIRIGELMPNLAR